MSFVRFVIFLALLIVMLSIPDGDREPRRVLKRPNTDLFFANYTDPLDLIEAVKAYAVSLCLNDKVVGTKPEDWLAAGRACHDSWASDEDDASSSDGGWRDYQPQAFREITALCRGAYRGQPLCKFVEK